MGFFRSSVQTDLGLICFKYSVMTNTAINLVAMLAVDRVHRPNACAFLMLASHFLGDVPLPILLGLVKNQFAPACTFFKNGDFADNDQCKEQEVGVRKSLAIAYAWVIWSLILFEIARRFAKREMETAKREVGVSATTLVNLVGDDEEGSHSDRGSTSL